MSRLLTLAIGLIAAACTSLPPPPASVSPTGRSEEPADTPVASTVPTPVASAMPTPVASASDPVQWLEPASYTFTLESLCGERALIGRFHVEVQSGKTVRVEAISGYGGSRPMPPSAVPTLANLLRLAADARSQSASEVSVVLDPIDGHPVYVSVDWQANAIDDEECYEITDYLPAPSA